MGVILIPGHPWSTSDWKDQSAHEQRQSSARQLPRGLLLPLQSIQQVVPTVPHRRSALPPGSTGCCPTQGHNKRSGSVAVKHLRNDTCKKNFWKGHFNLCQNRVLERATAWRKRDFDCIPQMWHF